MSGDKKKLNKTEKDRKNMQKIAAMKVTSVKMRYHV